MISAKASDIPAILPIWQPVGYSTYQITNQVAQKFGEKATHTGVLDPLAEGVIVILLGEERFKKMEHTSWLKEYEFELTFGVATDSYDGMGLITKTDFDTKIARAGLDQSLQKFVGAYSQKVPLYSAKKVDGKKLFMYPKLGHATPELPIKTGTIHEIKLLNFDTVSLHSKIKENILKVNSIQKGEFRQQEIIDAWEKFVAQTPDCLVEVAKIRVVLTRGLYVRSLAQDVAHALGKVGYVSQLIRTKNGDYAKKDCATLDELFSNGDSDQLRSQLTKDAF